jgi:hypothetical protein
VQFTANGITKDGLVTDVTPSTVTVQTPYPRADRAGTLTSITLTLGTNLATPSVLSLPNCFSFGTSASNQPTITALLPSQGTFSGGTRVTIIGSGFSSAGVQVFFGSAEATVVSTSFSQIVAPRRRLRVGPGGNPFRRRHGEEHHLGCELAASELHLHAGDSHHGREQL